MFRLWKEGMYQHRSRILKHYRTTAAEETPGKERGYNSHPSNPYLELWDSNTIISAEHRVPQTFPWPEGIDLEGGDFDQLAGSAIFLCSVHLQTSSPWCIATPNALSLSSRLSMSDSTSQNGNVMTFNLLRCVADVLVSDITPVGGMNLDALGWDIMGRCSTWPLDTVDLCDTVVDQEA